MKQHTVTFYPIGVISTEHHRAQDTPIQPMYAKGCMGTVAVFPEFEKGLEGIEVFTHLYLIFHLHQSGSAALTVTPFLHNKECGVFATRSPHRPNALGMSVVELLSREGNILHVRGVDMLDGTPLLDIKPYTARLDNIPEAGNGWLESVDEETARKAGSRSHKGDTAV